ncbi:hypothetical protein HAT2_00677 [Candidatus Similichlamydia laticola]|uniref:Uncharacterized protein n=1 Tax=Candidatus Similichlamydia laticola TaxID=2170265 RepID=A0A369KE70_9BACT|nr:hypothetical protein HAT2_00677 [Candidatus Similichlamydia laticola]
MAHAIKCPPLSYEKALEKHMLLLSVFSLLKTFRGQNQLK